jgi:transcriptional repressor NrdR
VKCPYCKSGDTRVVDSRDAEEGGAIRRRRECLTCGERVTTYERPLTVRLDVKKRDGRLEPFQHEKLSRGVFRAFEKRPVPAGALDDLVDGIEDELRSRGQRVIESKVIGELVCERIKRLDEVAYLRFASVYKDFSDGRHFVEELEALKS